MSEQKTIQEMIVEIDKRNSDHKIKDFDFLLDKIVSTDDSNKTLWKEIYQNAITDRQNAYAMFVQTVEIVKDKSTEHAVHGRTIATYIERMSKANEQLIKLAELITRAQEKQNEIDPDIMFEKIKSSKN